MEQLLFLLFVLFSVGSALLERRKRKKQREEQNKQPQEQKTTDDSKQVNGEEKEKWPFPMGGDPFESIRARSSSSPRWQEAEDGGEISSQSEAVEESPESSPPSAKKRRPSIFQRLEEYAQETERRVRESDTGEFTGEDTFLRTEQERPPEEVAVEVDVAQSTQNAEGSAGSQVPKNTSVTNRKKRRRWAFTPQTTRDAIVYAEILGKPKAEREEEFFN